jgi:hypothetical protein
VDQKKIKWPDLKSIGHVKGRLATEEDVNAGNAVFVLRPDDENSIPTPIHMDIPQYALHTNKQTGEKTPGIIIQAEQSSQGQKVVGFLTLESKKFLAALLHEFILVGKEKL